MRYSWIVRLTLCVPLLGAIAFAQPSTGVFHFKDAYLGMTLTEFKAAFAGASVRVHTGNPDWRGLPKRKNDKILQTPFCTDTVNAFPGDEVTLDAEEVLCNASPNGVNPDLIEIVGKAAYQITYRFYREKLYLIRIETPATNFEITGDGFVRKYGEPSNRTEEAFQNAFGAVWKGHQLLWKNAIGEVLYLREGSGDGPGQSGFDRDRPCVAIFLDSKLGPALNTKPAIDF